MSVVLCAYDEERYSKLVAAVRSVRRQWPAPREVIVSVDNNPRLLARVRADMPAVHAVEHSGVRGAGAARNRGVACASGSIIAFLDDDALATRDWIATACAAFADERVLGVGGTIRPHWESVPPRWLPAEFYWTVGCTYPGLPTSVAPVRNLIAASMFMRRDAFVELDGFREGFGKTGPRSGTDETDLCIRANLRWPERVWLYDPAIVVLHSVPASRVRLAYFLTRCYDEGVAKAAIVALLGEDEGLAAERRYAARVLPAGFLRGLRDLALHGDVNGIARSSCIAAGLASTICGYLTGTLRGAKAGPSAIASRGEQPDAAPAPSAAGARGDGAA